MLLLCIIHLAQEFAHKNFFKILAHEQIYCKKLKIFSDLFYYKNKSGSTTKYYDTKSIFPKL